MKMINTFLTNRKPRLLLISLISSMLIDTSLSAKTISQPQSFNQEIAAIGVSYQIKNENLNIFINKQKMLQSIKLLQKKGEIDRRLSQNEINFYKPKIPGSISIDYTAKILKNTYATHQSLDKLHVTVYLISQNLYGNNADNICYSFDFNRKIYTLINWKNFKNNNIAKISPNFQKSELCNSIIEDKLLFSSN